MVDADRFAPLPERGRNAGKTKAETLDGELVVPIPADVPAPSMIHKPLGQPAGVWTYRDSNGAPLAYIARYDKPDGDKEFLPRTWWRPRSGKCQWRWKNLPAPRPLYGLELLGRNPDAPVVVVEGEKTADAARRIFPEHVAVSPMNGARSPDKADWALLGGRDVIIWPDNDQPGEGFVAAVAGLLKGVAASIRIVDVEKLIVIDGGKRPPTRKEKGWDAADALEEWTDLASLRETTLGLARPFVDEPAEDAASPRSARSDDKGEKASPKRPPQAEILVRLAKDQCAFFHDELGATYASLTAPHGGGVHREIHKLKSKSLKLWLIRAYYLDTGGVPNDGSIKSAIALMEAFARFDGPQREVFVRRAAHADKLYIDLCDDCWRAVEIDASGWRIIDEPPVCFVRASGMLTLPQPKRCDPKQGLARLRSLLRVRDHDDFVIIVGFLLDALGGRGPYTAIIFTGEPGATKTTHLKVLRSLFDPNASPVRSPPRELRDVYIAATKGAVLAYNNLSSLPDWLSNALCVVTEGSGDSRRELYSDDEESVIFARAPAMLTAVTNIIARGDLASRTLYAALAPVPPYERKDETELWKEVEAARPEILAALLAGLSEGLRRLSTLTTPLPRMATFAKLVSACETAFWPKGTFLSAYNGNADSAAEDVIEDDIAVSTFRVFMTGRSEWKGTATDLLAALVQLVKEPERDAIEAHRAATREYDVDAQIVTAAALREAQQRSREILAAGWPSKPHVLSGRLKKSGPQLRKLGISISWPTSHSDGRTITVDNHLCHMSANLAS